MPTKYTITVDNKSGADKNYVIFSEKPRVTGSVSSEIWSNVMDSAATPEDQTAQWEITKEYSAVCGHSADKPSAGIRLTVQGKREVTLGTTSSDGGAVPGTSLALQVKNDAPSFKKPDLENASDFGSYQVVTGNDFTVEEARDNNYMIGLGAAVSQGGDSELKPPAASFIPEPGTSYQIQPVNIFYVCFGSFKPGTLINVTAAGSKVKKVDFNALGKNKVRIIHDANGNLNIQA